MKVYKSEEEWFWTIITVCGYRVSRKYRFLISIYRSKVNRTRKNNIKQYMAKKK